MAKINHSNDNNNLQTKITNKLIKKVKYIIKKSLKQAVTQRIKMPPIKEKKPTSNKQM